MLPRQKLTLFPGTGTDKAISIRSGVADGKFYFYVVNSRPEPTEVRLALTGAGRIRELATDRETPVSRRAGGGGVVSVALGPYGMKSFYAEDATLRVASFSQ